MVAFWITIFSQVELVATVVVTIVSAVIGFTISNYYWSLDHRANQFDDDVRTQIKAQPALNGLEGTANTQLIATSNDASSKAISRIQELRGRRGNNPDKIIVFETDDLEQRKIEMVRDRIRTIPGKTILNAELIASIRMYYGYRVCIATEGVDSIVTEHFKDQLEEYEFSEQVKALGKSENYETVMLNDADGEAEDRDALNDVFLKMVSAVERGYIQQSDSLEETEELVEECQQVLVPFFLGLRYGKILGVVADEETDNDEYIHKYRIDLRDNDNWGYWLLTDSQCEEDDFDAVRHLCWRIDQLVEDSWDSNNFNKIHPKPEDLTEMDYVETPFFILQMEERIYRGGGPGSQS